MKMLIGGREIGWWKGRGVGKERDGWMGGGLGGWFDEFIDRIVEVWRGDGWKGG